MLTAVDGPAGGASTTGARRLPQLPFHPVKRTFVKQSSRPRDRQEDWECMRGSGAPGARLETQTG